MSTTNKVLLTLGALAAVGGAIYLACKKGKSPAVPNNPNPDEKPFKIVRKFFNGDNEIPGVKLEKGIATNQDGSVFTGVMKTANRKGQNVQLTFEDGYITKSEIDGKIFKTFEDPQFPDNNSKEMTIPRAKAVEITTYDDRGSVKKQAIHSYYDNGKIRRIYKTDDVIGSIYNNNKRFAIDFSQDGKITGKEVYNHGGLIETATRYDEKGNIVKIMEAGKHDDNFGLKELYIDENGNKIKEIYSNDGYISKNYNMYIYPFEIYKPYFVRYNNGAYLQKIHDGFQYSPDGSQIMSINNDKAYASGKEFLHISCDIKNNDYGVYIFNDGEIKTIINSSNNEIPESALKEFISILKDAQQRAIEDGVIENNEKLVNAIQKLESLCKN